MTVVAGVLVVLVAALHAYFALLEMVLWTTPRGRAAFGLEERFAQETKTLAANQGLYNLFLVVGLVLGLFAGDHRVAVLSVVLGCVVVAGLYGGATVGRRILFVQAVPGALALLAVQLSR